MNQSAHTIALREDGLVVRNNRLTCKQFVQSAKLEHDIIEATALEPKAGRMQIGRGEGVAPYLVNIVPLPAAVFEAPLALVTISDPEQYRPREENLMEAFQLSRAQARVAVKLMDGKVAADIVPELAISMPTVRSHISDLLRKVGVPNQVDLVRVLAMSHRTRL